MNERDKPFKERLLNAITGRGTGIDQWWEAEAAETRATLRALGISRIITGRDIKDSARWSAQDRREQLDLAIIAQSKREQLNLAALAQDGDNE